MALIVIHSSLQAGNYVLNPDFESQGISSGEKGIEGWDSDFHNKSASNIINSGLKSMMVDTINSSGCVAFYPEAIDDSHIIQLLKTNQNFPVYYKRMQVKFGGYVRAPSSTPDSLQVMLKVKDENNNYDSTYSSLYEFSSPNTWQLLEGEYSWSPDIEEEEDTLRYQLKVLTDDAFADDETVFVDDFFILPNFIPDPDFDAFTNWDDSYFRPTSNSPAYVSHDTLRDNGDKYLKIEAKHDKIGDEMYSYQNWAINVNNDYNKVFDFQYDVKLDTPMNESEYDTVVNTVYPRLRIMDNANTTDRVWVDGAFYNYWTTKDTTWQTIGFEIMNPDTLTGKKKRVPLLFMQDRWVYFDPDTNHSYGFDNLKLYEKIPIMPDISDIGGKIYPAEADNPSYPGEESSTHVNVEIYWRTGIRCHGGTVVILKSTGGAYTPVDTLYEDMDFMPKRVHRVSDKINKANTAIGEALGFKIYQPGIQRGYTKTDRYDLDTEIPTYSPTDSITESISIFKFSDAIEDKSPIILGVPILHKYLDDQKKFRVEKYNGENGWEDITTQSRILSYWFDHYEDVTSLRSYSQGIKWLLAGFQAEEGGTYQIKYGDISSTEPNTNKFLITDEDTCYFLTNRAQANDSLSFRVSTQEGDLKFLYDLYFGGNTLLSPADSVKSFITFNNQNNTVYGSVDEAKLIDNGEIFGTLELKLKHKSGTDSLYSFLVFNVFKDMPYFTFDYKVLNEKPSEKTEKSNNKGLYYVFDAGLSVPIAVNSEDTLNCIFGLDNGVSWDSLLTDSLTYRLVQTGDEETTTYPGGSVRGVMYDFDFKLDRIKKETDTTLVRTDTTASGWCGFYENEEDPDSLCQIFFGYPQFWQQYPSGLSIEREDTLVTLRYNFCPQEQDTLKFPYSSRMSWYNAFMRFHGYYSDSVCFEHKAMDYFDSTAFAILPESYYDTTEAFGGTVRESYWTEGTMIKILMDYYKDIFISGTQGYNRGFLLTKPKVADNDSSNRIGYGEDQWGEYIGADGAFSIANNEYELGGGIINMALITEDDTYRPVYYYKGINQSRYYLDYVSHRADYDGIRQYIRETVYPEGLPHEHDEHVHAGRYDRGHCIGIPMLYKYYSLTGDPDASHMIKSFADAVVPEAEPAANEYMYRCSGEAATRLLAWPAFTLLEAYKATGDKFYVMEANNIIENVFSYQDDTGEYGNFLSTKGGFPHTVPTKWGSTEDSTSIDTTLGCVQFTTSVFNQALAKYHEITGDNSFSSEAELLNEFLRNMYSREDSAFYYYTNYYYYYQYDPGLEDEPPYPRIGGSAMMAAPGIKYYGIAADDSLYICFADTVINDFNDADVGAKPQCISEAKAHGQSTCFILDMLKHFK